MSLVASTGRSNGGLGLTTSLYDLLRAPDCGSGDRTDDESREREDVTEKFDERGKENETRRRLGVSSTIGGEERFDAGVDCCPTT